MKKKPSMLWEPGPLYPYEPLVTVEFQCHHCRQHTKVLHKSIDDAEENYWRIKYESLLTRQNEAAKLCMLKHGTTPMYEEFQEQLRKIYNEREEGEEWKAKP